MPVQHLLCWWSVWYFGAVYDIFRVCRCTREYAGAPDGGAAVGDKFGAEARRPPPAACCCSQPHNPPFLHHQHFSYSTRSRMPEKKLNWNSFLIQKLHLLYFRSNILENHGYVRQKIAQSWTKCLVVAFTSLQIFVCCSSQVHSISSQSMCSSWTRSNSL